MYLLKLSLRPWRIALGSQVFTSGAIGFLLMLGGALFWLQASLGPVISTLQAEQVVTLYLEASLPSGGEGQVLNQVQDALSDLTKVGASVHFTDTTEFINTLKVKYPQLATEVEGLGSDQTWVVPRTITVKGELNSERIERLRRVSGIESLETSRDRYLPVIEALRVLQWVIRLLMIGIAFALLTGLVHLSRMNATLHQDAVSLLRLWGANERTLHAPGILSGLAVGVLGGAAAWIGWSTLGLWIAQSLRGLTPLLEGARPPSVLMGFGFVFVGAVLGVIAGVFGASQLGMGKTE